MATAHHLLVSALLHPAVILPPPAFLVAFLLSIPKITEAQSSSSSPPTSSAPDGGSNGGYALQMSPAAAVVAFGFLLVFFVLFIFVFFPRCHGNSYGDAGLRRRSSAAAVADRTRAARGGLDQAVLETFPTMKYLKAKELNATKQALECAVCLSEFSDDDNLRLLPGCCHVFHVNCIDVWLESHVTCPVCRSILSDPAAAAATASAANATNTHGDPGTEPEGGQLELGRPTAAVPMRRWNSTGHDVEAAGTADRYTLHLPEHVAGEMFLRESSTVEAPDRGGSLASRSSRWLSLLRMLSDRRRAEGAVTPAEGSTRRVFPTIDGDLSDHQGFGGGAAAGGSAGSGMQDESPSSTTSEALGQV